jgi:thiol-disulfide isomerase/thioredoxin
MALTDLGNAQELQAFLQQNPVCLITFSAHWCGPCTASKPQLEQMAKDSTTPFGYTYESDLGDFLHTFSVRAFPTYILFEDGKELERVEGVNFPAIQEMISKHAPPSIPQAGGNSLGGGGVSPEEARKIRLARLTLTARAPAAAADEAPTPMETSTPTAATAASNEKMKEDDPMNDAEEKPSSNPVDNLDVEALKTLTESMGFTLLRAQKGLLFSQGATVESAVEWLMEHQDDADIDEPIPEGAVGKAQSYKCNECGKILSNMANLELHANKTGHSDFEESTHLVKPLTPEEKAAKMAEIKVLIKQKRAEREEVEKVDNVEREKQRRSMGKEMKKTREEMDAEQRKRDTAGRKREKIEAKKERDRIREMLEKDKRERRANNGKLKSSLGVDGYNPSAIQYDTNTAAAAADTEEPAAQRPKKSHPEVAKIDDYIKKVSSYRAGGDGGKCLKILKTYVGNVADNPREDKFKNINMDNKGKCHNTMAYGLLKLRVQISHQSLYFYF